MPLKVAQEFLMKEAVVASLKFASGLQEKYVCLDYKCQSNATPLPVKRSENASSCENRRF